MKSVDVLKTVHFSAFGFSWSFVFLASGCFLSSLAHEIEVERQCTVDLLYKKTNVCTVIFNNGSYRNDGTAFFNNVWKNTGLGQNRVFLKFESTDVEFKLVRIK